MVEVKYYRSKFIPNSNIKSAIYQLISYLSLSGAYKGLLIINSNLDTEFRLKLEEDYGIDIWNRGILYYLSSVSVDIRSEYESILLSLLQSSEEDVFGGMNVTQVYDLNKLWIGNYRPFRKGPTLKNKGERFCKELNNLAKGRSQAKNMKRSTKKF